MLIALVINIICMFGFSQTTVPNTTNRSAELDLGSNPVLSFMPMPESKEGSTLIWLQTFNKTNYLQWKTNLLEKLDKYYTPGKTEKGNNALYICSYDNKPIRGKVCDVDVRNWEPCIPENNFNYHRSAPCIFLKLNKLFDGWEPQYYNDTRDLPEDMPFQLKEHIRLNITNPSKRNNVWVTCGGEYPVDVEYLGPVNYYPSIQGFPGYYFPYVNSKEYLSPLLAVQFKRPAIGVVVNIECRAWAKNIKYNKTTGSGYVHFELLVD